MSEAGRRLGGEMKPGRRYNVVTIPSADMPTGLAAMSPGNVAGRWLAEQIYTWGMRVEEPGVAGPSGLDALRLAAKPTAAEAMARFLNVKVQPEQSPFREAWNAIGPRLWPVTALRYLDRAAVNDPRTRATNAPRPKPGQ